MTGRKPFLDALVGALAREDVVVSCLGANARWLPHMNVTVPVFALCDSMGAAVPLAYQPPHDMGTSYTVPLPTLAQGAYVLSWRMIARDGHVMNGVVHFSIAP